MNKQTRKALELARDALMEVEDPKAWPFEIKQARQAAIAAIDAALSAHAAPRAPLTDEQIESIIENSDGRWVDGEFRIDGPDLTRMLRSIHGIGHEGSS